MAESVGGSGGDPERLQARLREMKEQVAQKDEDIRLLKLRLELLSTLDGATGLLNRNGLIDSLESALHRIGRRLEPFAVVGLSFPGLPDTRAHPSTEVEAALQHIAALLRAALRDIDRIGRLEGARFVALLPLTAGTTAEPVLPRLRSVLSAGPIQIGGREYDPTPHFVIVHVKSEGRPDVPDTETILQLIDDGMAAPGAEPVRHAI